MKLLFENWRKFLKERKTDVLYENITEFFLKFIRDLNNFYDIKDYVWNLGLTDEDTGGQFAFLFKTRPESVDEELFEEYQAMTQDETIMSDFETFKEALTRFEVMVVWDLRGGDAAGDMGPGGRMRLSASHIGLKEQQFDEFTTKQIHAQIQQAISEVSEILDHELTHYLNAIRSGHKPYRAPGGQKQFSPETQEYIDSTEEIQARVVAAIKSFKDSAVYKDGEFVAMSPEEFMEWFIYFYGSHYWEKTSPKLKQRIYKRALDTENGIFANLKRQWERQNPTPVLERHR